jgi:hypothetical protein
MLKAQIAPAPPEQQLLDSKAFRPGVDDHLTVYDHSHIAPAYSHTSTTNNPHSTTAAQVGAEPSGTVATHAGLTATHGVTGALVGTTDNQTISNKKYGGATNYSEFETDGTLVAHGNATTWNDINISLVPPAGVTAAPAVIAVNGDAWLSCYAFSGTNPTPDVVHSGLEILHDYKEGSDIQFHVHWAPINNGIGAVKWHLRYAWFNHLGIPSGVSAFVISDTSGVPWKEQTSTITISGTGKTMGSRFLFALIRDPADVDDTYAFNVATFDMGIHYERDTLGSRQITTK